MSAREHLFSVLGKTRPESSCEVSCRSGSPSTPGSSCPSPSPSPSAPSSVQGPQNMSPVQPEAAKLAVSPSPGPSDLGPLHAPAPWPFRLLGGSWRLYRQPLWGHFSDSAPGEGLEKLALVKALCAQTAGTRPRKPQSPASSTTASEAQPAPRRLCDAPLWHAPLRTLRPQSSVSGYI